MTVEVFDAKAEKFFLRYNKAAIELGYIVPTEKYTQDVGTINIITDVEINEILTFPFGKFKKRLEEFTSPIPVHRLLDAAKEANKPYNTIKFIEQQAEKLKNRI